MNFLISAVEELLTLVCNFASGTTQTMFIHNHCQKNLMDFEHTVVMLRVLSVQKISLVDPE